MTMTIARMMRSSGSPIRPMEVLLEAVIVLLFTFSLRAGQFSSGVNLVEVYATVTDPAGEPVAGLAARDFEVLEDGTPQAVTPFTAGDVPLSIGVALDRSFSMTGERLALARGAGAGAPRARRPTAQTPGAAPRPPNPT